MTISSSSSSWTTSLFGSPSIFFISSMPLFSVPTENVACLFLSFAAASTKSSLGGMAPQAKCSAVWPSLFRVSHFTDWSLSSRAAIRKCLFATPTSSVRIPTEHRISGVMPVSSRSKGLRSKARSSASGRLALRLGPPFSDSVLNNASLPRRIAVCSTRWPSPPLGGFSVEMKEVALPYRPLRRPFRQGTLEYWLMSPSMVVPPRQASSPAPLPSLSIAFEMSRP
mmetsp:Transcript_10043/g.25581  ORF Transcript_10043/g.25581 Transcript_10043/m.25581 type:complete len:225 (-) Transcript_10043:804-1478(-)